MKSYKQFCPISRVAEIFAERWTPLIIRNMSLGCETFTQSASHRRFQRSEAVRRGRVPLSGLDGVVARSQHPSQGRRVTTPTSNEELA